MFRKKTAQHNKEESSSHHGHHKKLRKKIGVFYKINFTIITLISLILFYFVILVSAKPKSFPYFTQKIKSYLEQNFDSAVEIKDSTVSFTAYGSFKLAADNLKITKLLQNGEHHEIILPRIETEFSLFDFILMRFTPSKVKIINPEIAINNFSATKSSESLGNDFEPIVDFFSQIKNGKIHLKIFEIENAKFIIHKKNENDKIIILRKSQFHIKTRGLIENNLQITSSNLVNVNGASKDISVNANCILDNKNLTNCDFSLANFDVALAEKFSEKLKILRQVNVSLNATAKLIINNDTFESLSFKAEAKNGEAEIADFFAKKIFFSNLSIAGNYDFASDKLSLSEIKANLLNSLEEKNNTSPLKNLATLNMSLIFSSLSDSQNNKTDFDIKIANVLDKELERFWPIAIPGQDIREWFLQHVAVGVVNSAYAKFSLVKLNGISVLEKIDSEVNFSDMNLRYDEYFPNISNLRGIAKFTKNDMKINVVSGAVLDSKISNAQVSINDFSDITTVLNITGKLVGPAADTLKHADYNSINFIQNIEKYLNGSAESTVDLKIPLIDKLALKDIYLDVKSTIENLKNDYVEGGVMIFTKKMVDHNNFITSIDLTASSLVAKAFDVEKKQGNPGALEFTLIIDDHYNLNFKNINLWKKEEITENKITKNVEAKILGSLEVNTTTGAVTSLNIKNNNFGNNNYVISYQNFFDKNKQKIQQFSLSGANFNLASFLENKLPEFSSDDQNIAKTNVKITVDKVFLVNKKSLRKLSVNFNQANGFLYSLGAKALYGNKQTFNFASDKNSKDQLDILGKISDVGYLAEGLAISDKISSGNAKIKITQDSVNNKPILNGQVEINNNITFYESNTTKRLEKNNLFSSVKDKIFSNNKTIFNLVKIDFSLQKKQLKLNSFVANNYKIGITAKGNFNFADDSYDINGMIIPGFVINNLFGIGNIPLIGGVISGALTGGEGGGLFGIKYQYKKLPNQKEPTFETNTLSSFVPVSIRSLFE